jgi:hypothetical protein
VAVFGIATGLVTAALSAAQRGSADLPMSEDRE